MDTPKKFMDTASPVAQDKQGRVLELGRGSSPKSELQSPASGSPPGVTDADTAVVSSSPLGVINADNAEASSSSLGATASSCTQHDVLPVDCDMVMTCDTDPSRGEPGSSQQQPGTGLFGTTGLTKNQRRKQRKWLQKQKFKAAAAGHSNVIKRPLPESSAPFPSVRKKVREDVQPRKNTQPWKDVQPVEDVQPWEKIHTEEDVPPKKNVQPQQYIQPWENIHPVEDIQPWKKIHSVEDVQPWKNIHPAQDIQPWKNTHPVQGIQPHRDVRSQRDLRPQKEVQPQKHVQPNPCIKMVIVKMNFPSDRLSADEAESIQREILMLTDSIPIGARLPKILAINLVKGSLIIQCSDIATVEWIRSNFSNNSKVLGDAALRVLNADELPKPVKVAFKTKEKFSDQDAFLRRLQRLNPGLKATEWRVLKCTAEANVARWILEVDSADLEAIRRADFGAFTGLDRGVFKILYDPNRREPLEMEHTAPAVPSASATTSSGRQGFY